MQSASMHSQLYWGQFQLFFFIFPSPICNGVVAALLQGLRYGFWIRKKMLCKQVLAKFYRKKSNQILQVLILWAFWKKSNWQNDKFSATFINFVKFCGAYETKRLFSLFSTLFHRNKYYLHIQNCSIRHFGDCKVPGHEHYH